MENEQFVASKIKMPTIEKILNDIIFQGAKATSLLIYLRGNLVFYKTTNYTYQDAYLSSSKEVEQCHLAQIAIKRINEAKPYSIIWDSIPPNNEASMFLNELRLKYEHCHGITLLNPISGDLLIGLTIAGRRCDVNLVNDVLKSKASINKQFQRILLSL